MYSTRSSPAHPSNSGATRSSPRWHERDLDSNCGQCAIKWIISLCHRDRVDWMQVVHSCTRLGWLWSLRHVYFQLVVLYVRIVTSELIFGLLGCYFDLARAQTRKTNLKKDTRLFCMSGLHRVPQGTLLTSSRDIWLRVRLLIEVIITNDKLAAYVAG